MNLRQYQEWLVGEQWNGYPLDVMLVDACIKGDVQPRVSGHRFEALRSLFIITNGLNGEAGEATEHFKKWVRDERINKREAGIELGDVLAYLTWCAAVLGYTLEEIAGMSHEKLTARFPERQKEFE